MLTTQRSWSCLEIRMQDEVKIWRLIIVLGKGGTVQIFGTTLTNQNSIEDEIKSRLNSGNACFHSVQNILSSSLLSHQKITMYRTVISPVDFTGVKLGRSQVGRNVSWGFLRIGHWGEYLGLRGRGNRGEEETT